MADSNITKRALAAALKELMEEMPFDKISVAQICERCDMHRKSFYYHFKDKYDLLNWIFDSEIISVIQSAGTALDYDAYFAFIQDFLTYFYKNKDFYRKAFQIRGQNAFRDHFQEYIRPLIRFRFEILLQDPHIDEFDIDIFADVTLCIIERWLQNGAKLPPEQIVSKLKLLIQHEITALEQMQGS